MSFPHNPAHAFGTCAKCGEEVVANVPRMGIAGGFVHKATGRLECDSPPNDSNCIPESAKSATVRQGNKYAE